MSVRGTIDSFLESLFVFEAEVEKVFDDGTVEITTRQDQREIVSAPYFGGVRDHGIFYHPKRGDKVLCARVHPGPSGSTQIIRPLASPSNSVRHDGNDGTVVSGTSPYPYVDEGDIRITSTGGSEVFLKGSALKSEAGLITSHKNGVYVNASQDSDGISLIAEMNQVVTSGHRGVSGPVIRSRGGSNIGIPVGHNISAYSSLAGNKIGFFDGEEPQSTALLGRLRNLTLSEHRLTVNEFCEEDAFTGFDQEEAYATSENTKNYEDKSHLRSIDSRSSLNLAPHQLIEVISGNVVNSAGQLLDINYSSVPTGDAEGRPEVGTIEFEKNRRISRRGLGYHFQLSTNSISSKGSNDIDNFIFALDKKGLLKVNVPVSDLSDNIMFPTAADFSHSSGQVLTRPLNKSVKHPVPVYLRDKNGETVLPALNAADFVKNKGGQQFRETGVRFLNNSNYFEGFEGSDKSGAVRVNFTAYHNMYAAAEMLIANTISQILIPNNCSVCPGHVVGSPVNEPFERYLGPLNGAGVDPDTALKYMSTVAVEPQKPAMYSGGETTVAGETYSELKGFGAYSNSFSVTKDEKGLGVKSEDKTFDPGGKSANINFEGAVDVSVGKDNTDQKSLVLDTAGSMIAWLGKDEAGRSLVLQTDGAMAINVGGRSTDKKGEDTFHHGRFDLRVNINDKGVTGAKYSPQEARHESDYIISISNAGLVIAGMHPSAPMVIRNAGDLLLESTGKLSLAGQVVEIREGNAPPKKPDKSNSGQHQPVATVESVSDQLTCVTDILSKLSES
tara:strand:- start:4248 stop:6599 length:2352 start_codon:yes stop_codon:yes gene_type:complete